MSNSDELTREQIAGLLEELGRELAAEGRKAQLFIVGGAAMALAFNTRRMTRDVDGVFEPKAVVYAAAKRVAERHGLPEDWLNDSVKGLLPGPDPNATTILDVPGVTVQAPSAEYLLAMKIQAARVDRDLDDIRFLAARLGVSTSAEVLAVAEKVIGRDRLLPKAQYVIESEFGLLAPPPNKPHDTSRSTFWQRLSTWLAVQQERAKRRRATAADRHAANPKPPKPGRPPRRLGRTRAGRRCILRSGHGGHCRGR